MYPSEDSRKDFYTWLAGEVGLDPSNLYVRKVSDIPSPPANQEHTASPAIVPIHLFSFAEDAGLTGAPELDKSKKMLELLFSYGFQSADEVVRVRVPAALLQLTCPLYMHVFRLKLSAKHLKGPQTYPMLWHMERSVRPNNKVQQLVGLNAFQRYEAAMSEDTVIGYGQLRQ